MSALIPKPLLEVVMAPKPNRTAEIERFMREHPDKVKRLAPVPLDDRPRVNEQFDRVRIGQTLGTYRRRKHGGSDEQ